MKPTRSLQALIRVGIVVFCAAWLMPPGGADVAHAWGDPPMDAGLPATPPKKPAAKKTSEKPAAAAKKPAATNAPPARVQTVRRAIPRETAPSGLPPEGETRFIEDQVIVRYRLGARQSAMDALVRQLNLLHVEGRTFVLPGVTVHLYRITDGSSVAEVIAALEADPTVVYAQPNYLYELLQSAGAASGPQYALERLAIGPAHELATGYGVRIAVIDSQIDAAHAEFGKAKIEVLDATGETDAPAHAHGTSIAGIIASRGTLLGISPDVGLVGIRAFLEDESRASAYSTTWRVAAGLDQSLAAQARIVNMSFAGPQDPLVGGSVAGLVGRGMIGVAAAGNEGPEARPLYPAAYPGVIAVTAVDKDNVIYGRANQGAHVALAAPGVDILVPVPSNGYQLSSGTSLAAAHISGLAALMLSREPSLTAAEVAEILLSSSADLGSPGRDAVFGAGLPDALMAIKSVLKSQ